MKLSVVNFRLKPEEEQALRMKAAADGMNVSDFCRSRILSENVPHETSKDDPIQSDFLKPLEDRMEQMEFDIQTSTQNAAKIAKAMSDIIAALNDLTKHVQSMHQTMEDKL